MATLPKLRPGLDLYRSSDEAVYVGFIVFLLSFGLLLAPLLASIWSRSRPLARGGLSRFSRCQSGLASRTKRTGYSILF